MRNRSRVNAEELDDRVQHRHLLQTLSTDSYSRDVLSITTSMFITHVQLHLSMHFQLCRRQHDVDYYYPPLLPLVLYNRATQDRLVRSSEHVLHYPNHVGNMAG